MTWLRAAEVAAFLVLVVVMVWFDKESEDRRTRTNGMNGRYSSEREPWVQNGEDDEVLEYESDREHDEWQYR